MHLVARMVSWAAVTAPSIDLLSRLLGHSASLYEVVTCVCAYWMMLDANHRRSSNVFVSAHTAVSRLVIGDLSQDISTTHTLTIHLIFQLNSVREPLSRTPSFNIQCDPDECAHSDSTHVQS